MNLIFRLIWLLITASGRRRIDLVDECELPLRVWPTDLDINMHLTNARYLSMMDLGRVELIMQTGMFKELMKRRWLPVVASANLKFYRQIKPFHSYKLKTRILGWDDKWFYIEQRFEVGQRLAAVGVIKGLFRGPEGNVSTTELLKLADYVGDSPELPGDLEQAFYT